MACFQQIIEGIVHYKRCIPYLSLDPHWHINARSLRSNNDLSKSKHRRFRESDMDARACHEKNRLGSCRKGAGAKSLIQLVQTYRRNSIIFDRNFKHTDAVTRFHWGKYYIQLNRGECREIATRSLRRKNQESHELLPPNSPLRSHVVAQSSKTEAHVIIA